MALARWARCAGIHAPRFIAARFHGESTEQGSYAAGAMGTEAATFCRTLADEWIRLGVTDAVISPGSRSTPLVLALDEHDGLRVHVHHDERCAGFMALGMAMGSGRPALVVTTSGTAAVELHPAVVEAHQAHVPLIACTADRPPELHGVGAPQAIDQAHLFGRAVCSFADPGPPNERERERWRPLAASVLAEAMSSPPGPVHLNLAFREPLVGEPDAIPEARSVELADLLTRRPAEGLPDHKVSELVGLLHFSTGVIVAGVRAARDQRDAGSIVALAGELGWPVLADPLSGCRVPDAAVVSTYDPILRSSDFAEAHRPEVVFRFGGLLSSRALNDWLASSGAEQVGVDRYGEFADPDRTLTQRITADPATLCRQLVDHLHEGAPSVAWTQVWQRASQQERSAVDAVLDATDDLTEPGLARDLLAAMPAGRALVVSSSMPVRDLEWYSRPQSSRRVLSNRGANGIDGVISTALGVAATGTPTTALVGDVAFLHDSNALLGLARRDVDLNIVVVDNDGGGIFSFLPQATALPEPMFERLFATPHGVDVAAVARALGSTAVKVSSQRTYRDVLDEGFFASGEDSPTVLVASVDRGHNVEVHDEINQQVAAAVGFTVG